MERLRIEHIHSLTEDELTMLWFCINVVNPKILSYEIPPELFPCIKYQALKDRILQCEQFVKEEYKNIFNEMKKKLEMPYTEPAPIIENTPTSSLEPIAENAVSSSIEENNNLNNSGSMVS